MVVLESRLSQLLQNDYHVPVNSVDGIENSPSSPHFSENTATRQYVQRRGHKLFDHFEDRRGK